MQDSTFYGAAARFVIIHLCNVANAGRLIILIGLCPSYSTAEILAYLALDKAAWLCHEWSANCLVSFRSCTTYNYS